MPARKSLDEKLRELNESMAAEDRDARRLALETALRAPHARLIARAAKLAAEGLHYDLLPLLQTAFTRLRDKGPKSDPGCNAKKTLARALVELDCDDVEFYLAGIRLRQPEPVWGGTVDTAIDVRTICACGLVACGYPRALIDLCDLLADPETEARVGAIHAIADANPRDAELLLRAKLACGDSEARVIGACLSALMSTAPETSIEIVARWLESEDDEVREQAALTLGECRDQAAFEALRAVWDNTLPSPDFRRILIRAAALHRSQAAFDWLVGLVTDASKPTAEAVIELLSIYQHNAKLARRIDGAVAKRGDESLRSTFRMHWTGAVDD